MDKPTPSTRAAWTVAEFCEHYRVSKSAVFILFNEKKLERRKHGRKTLIPVESADAWWASLQQAS